MDNFRNSLGVCLLSAASFFPLCTVSAQGEESVSFADLIEVVREVRADEPRAMLDADELFRRCAGDSEAYAYLFELLEARRVPALEGAGEQTLSEAQEELILTALAEAPIRRVLDVRDARLDQIRLEQEGDHAGYARASSNARRAAMQVAGISSDASEVDFLFEVAFVNGEDKLRRDLEQSFESALLNLLVAEPRALNRLQANWNAATSLLVVPSLRAVGRAGNAEGLSYIEEIIRWSPEHISAAAAQARLLGPSCDPSQNERLSQVLVSQLQDASPAVCISICQALGGIRSEVSLEALVELLSYEAPLDMGDGAGSSEQRVRDSALWALQMITKRTFQGDPKVWSLWLREEQRWLSQESDYWIRRLVSKDVAVSAEAIRTLAKRRYGREQLALAVARVLEVGQEEVKPMACIALTDLGSKSVMSWLLPALDSASLEVAEAALATIQSLTGKSLPLDRQAWCDALPEEAQYDW